MCNPKLVPRKLVVGPQIDHATSRTVAEGQKLKVAGQRILRNLYGRIRGPKVAYDDTRRVGIQCLTNQLDHLTKPNIHSETSFDCNPNLRANWKIPDLRPDLLHPDVRIRERIKETEVACYVRTAQLKLPNVVWLHSHRYTIDESPCKLMVSFAVLSPNAVNHVLTICSGDRRISSNGISSSHEATLFAELLKSTRFSVELTPWHTFDMPERDDRLLNGRSPP
jgi:hypothetical protein